MTHCVEEFHVKQRYAKKIQKKRTVRRRSASTATVPAPVTATRVMVRVLTNEEVRFGYDLGEKTRRLYMQSLGVPVQGFDVGSALETVEAFIESYRDAYDNEGCDNNGREESNEPDIRKGG